MSQKIKTGKVSRRSFLQASSGAVAIPFLAGAYAAGSDTIRVGVIGCGGRGTGAAMDALAADPGLQIVALGDVLMDRVHEARRRLSERYPEQTQVKDDHCFEGFDAYKSVIEASDVVLIANAAKFHPMHQMAAIEAGKHVFVEKPHAIDPLGAKQVQAACDLAAKKNLCVVSGLQSRFHPGYQETMKRVHDGAIGDIIAIQETWLRPPYVLRERVPGMKEILHQASNQYHFNWLSGDDVPQTLIHNLDRSSWALHDAAPLSAYGMGGRSTLQGEIYGNVFDHHSVVYQFPEGVRVYAICRTIDNCYNENSSLILGSKGQCDLLRLRITGENSWEQPGRSADQNPYVLEHAALFSAIRSGETIDSGYHMVRSTLIGMMGQLSCYTGQEITWEQLLASDYYFPPKPEECNEETEPPVKLGPDGSYPVLVPGKTELI
ncbi:MAG: Gfo/Idh/MocA family oxidoreductase [Acidobacteriota bacterium]|nr:MAG: Gfo/Idh/MocA family oxidoreductase [Acidobacteriota bacterium]